MVVVRGMSNEWTDIMHLCINTAYPICATIRKIPGHRPGDGMWQLYKNCGHNVYVNVCN